MNRPISRSLVIRAAALAGLCLGLQAQNWAQVTANPAPAARNRAAMAYDAARGQTLLFGGYDGTTTPRSDFWSFNGTSWQQLGGTVPAGRWGHGMVYDTRRERAVLFGGFQPSLGNPLPDALALQDTWEYDGSGWTQVTPTTRPSARGYFGFAYDPIRARSVLFGGAGPNTSYLQDTWEWNGTAWTLVNTPARPSIRRGPAMAFDMERAEVVLFGGGAFGTQFGDTWVYNGSTWTQRNPATSPPARWETTLAFDPLCGRTLLMGGTTFNYQTIFADSWNWDGVTWTQVTGTQPQARHGVAATFDLQAGRSLWSGGRDAAGFRSDLWAWSGGCNRTMSTVTPAVAGRTAQYRYSYPATAVNNPYFELWTLRNPNAFPLQVPGIVSVGLTRVDLFFVLAQNFGVLGSSGQQNTVPFAIPSTTAVVGFTYDVQNVDVDVAANELYWAVNDVEATVAPGVPPVASFTALVSPGPLPRNVQFTDTSTGYPTSWQWDFQNDGIVDSIQQNPSWLFQSPAAVRLVASNPWGTSTVVIQVGSSPVAAFTANPSSGNRPLVVQFTDTSTGGVTYWQWDFESDGTVDSTLQYPQHTYTAQGTYFARLTTGNQWGQSSTQLPIVVGGMSIVMTETFATNANMDLQTSGGTWNNGARAGLIGGDGRHGSFDPALGGAQAAEYTWDTTFVTIPASATLNGLPVSVTDGRFYFTDFVLPAGVTINFAGPIPPQIYVRGQALVQGTIKLNGAAMTAFDGRLATNAPAPYANGQPGGLPGAGGGRGGKGGNECQGAGPIVVNGAVLTNGQNGEDVRLLAGHAYVGNAFGSGGRGSSMNPPTGVAQPNFPALSGLYRSYFAQGGSGGGFTVVGGAPIVTAITNLQVGSMPPVGSACNLFPYPPVPAPPGYSSLYHFLVGGAGGGGGGTHAFGTSIASGDVYVAGAGGSGGGGALALRAGGSITVSSAGSLQAKGGRGALITGSDGAVPANTNWGVAAPGGGGSGGSVLLQSGADISVMGSIDTGGGDGSRTGQIANGAFNVASAGGPGSPGIYRIEAAGSVNVGSQSMVPSYVPSMHVGPLSDRDWSSGCMSLWRSTGVAIAPQWLLYELDVDADGDGTVDRTYSDSGGPGTQMANDPVGPVVVKFQGCYIAVGSSNPSPGSIGPWRDGVGSGAGPGIGLDVPNAFRFSITFNRAFYPSAVVKRLRVHAFS